MPGFSVGGICEQASEGVPGNKLLLGVKRRHAAVRVGAG